MAKPLSVRWRKFCDEYLAIGNAGKAYIAAGYNAKDEKCAQTCAARLLRKAEIRSYIETTSQKLSRERIMSFQRRQELLTNSIENDYESNGQMLSQTALKAIDILNKMAGDYVTNVAVDNNVTVTLADDIKE